MVIEPNRRSAILKIVEEKALGTRLENFRSLLPRPWKSGLSKGRGQGREDEKKGLTQTSLLDHVVHPDSGRCADWIIYNAPWRHTTGIQNFITTYSVNWQAGELILACENSRPSSLPAPDLDENENFARYLFLCDHGKRRLQNESWSRSTAHSWN